MNEIAWDFYQCKQFHTRSNNKKQLHQAEGWIGALFTGVS